MTFSGDTLRHVGGDLDLHLDVGAHESDELRDDLGRDLVCVARDALGIKRLHPEGAANDLLFRRDG
jgi:hypothetical protein